MVFLFCAIVLPPLINIGRYQHKIAASISRSLGRPAHMSSVTLRLLPLPGFELSNFSVDEDPAFGAEPILRAESVVAYVRLLSLWRGRLEVSRVDLDNASLNLVRNSQGAWNFASVLVQAAQIPNAPTGQRYAGRAPRFPYIEATNSRVNFKEGNEKKPLSFLNADLSISLLTPNEWAVHFEAQPARTDLDEDLADTGVFRLDGTLDRAALLEQMPMKLSILWSNAPLGQLSRIALGQDIGWRGALDVAAQVSGTERQAGIRMDLQISGLRRSEFVPAHPLDVEASCVGSYRKQSASIEAIRCSAPVGSGELSLTGSVEKVQTHPTAGWALDIHQVPVSALLAALEEVHNGLGAGLEATGSLDGHFDYAGADAVLPVSGAMSVHSLTLTPSDGGDPLSLASLRFLCDSSNRAAAAKSRSGDRSDVTNVISSTALVLQPVQLAIGTATNLTVDGRFTTQGFDLHLSGGGALARLEAANKSFGFMGTSIARLSAEDGVQSDGGSRPNGVATATLDLTIDGPWLPPLSDSASPAAASAIGGSITIRNARLPLPYLSQPLRVLSAQGILGPSQMDWTSASISYGSENGGSQNAEATLEYPTHCVAGTRCTARFELSAPALDLGVLQSGLKGNGDSGEFVRELLDRIDGHPPRWPDLTGTIRVGNLSAGKLTLHDAAGVLEVAGSSIRVHSLTGSLLGGSMHLSGSMSVAGGEPQYRLEAQLADLSPSALAALFEERWGGGSANLSLRLQMSGTGAAELARSAAGALHWDWSEGSLAGHSSISEAAQPLSHFDRWSADATVQDRTIQISHSLLDRGRNAIPLSGTISFDREVDLKSGSDTNPFVVTGTMADPQVESPDTQARVNRVR